MTITQTSTILPTDTNSKLYLVPTPDPEFGQEWFHPKFLPTPSRLDELPDLYSWSKSFIIVVIEIWSGRRSVMQLAKNCHRSVMNKIIEQRKTLNIECQISKIYVSQPIEGVMEVAVTLKIKNRVRSLILRFEGVDKKWICTELDLL
jgi:hypothetical protein